MSARGRRGSVRPRTGHPVAGRRGGGWMEYATNDGTSSERVDSAILSRAEALTIAASVRHPLPPRGPRARSAPSPSASSPPRLCSGAPAPRKRRPSSGVGGPPGRRATARQKARSSTRHTACRGRNSRHGSGEPERGKSPSSNPSHRPPHGERDTEAKRSAAPRQKKRTTRSSPELCVKVRGSSSMLLLGCLGDLLRFEKREIGQFAPDRS